jgi:prolyl-tRNA synthetase
VRWELRPRLFLRTSEFLWQEGHTAHASEREAAEYARRIHLDVYRAVLEGVLAIPVLTGLKTPSERFAGASATLTCEGMMRDGKALQLATSHELGQHFARVRLCHGDDAGLHLPPAVAPAQVVLVAVGEDPDVHAAVDRLEQELSAAGLRTRVDRRTEVGLGRRLTDWELKGVPVRLEVGPRDLASRSASLVRRDGTGRTAVPLSESVAAAGAALASLQDALLEQARTELERRTVEVTTLDQALEASADGFARLAWGRCGLEGERRANAAGVTVRC